MIRKCTTCNKEYEIIYNCIDIGENVNSDVNVISQCPHCGAELMHTVKIRDFLVLIVRTVQKIKNEENTQILRASEQEKPPLESTDNPFMDDPFSNDNIDKNF